MLAIAQPTAKATPLLLWVDARKSFLGQHLPVKR